MEVYDCLAKTGADMGFQQRSGLLVVFGLLLMLYGNAVRASLSFSPAPTNAVTLSDGAIGDVGSASISIVVASINSGTRISLHDCQFSGSGAGVFAPPTTVPSDGAFFNVGEIGSIELSCTLGASLRNATLSCTQTSIVTRGPTKEPIARGTLVSTWPVRCPPGAPADPPVLQYQPPPGSTSANAPTVSFSGSSGTTINATIGVSASGGSGSGADNTTTLGSCQISPSLSPPVFSCQPSGGNELSFVPGGPDPGDIACSCESPSTGTSEAVLSCTEQAGAGSPVTRVWNLSCSGSSPPTLSYQPTPAASLAAAPLVATSGAAGAALSLTIPVSATGGSGGGDDATARLGSCVVGAAPGSAGVYTCAPTAPALNFLPGQPDPGDIRCTCQSAVGGQYDAALRCTELTPVSTGTPQLHFWRLGCEVVAAAPVVNVSAPAAVIAGQPIALSWSSSGTSGGLPCTPTGGAGTGWVGLGTQAAQGQVSVVAPDSPQNLQFVLSCSNGNAIGSDSATVNVLAPPPPEVIVTVLPAMIEPSAPITLTWTSNAANLGTPCTPIGGGDSGWNTFAALPASGTQTINGPATPGSYDFLLSCVGLGGNGIGTAALEVVGSGSLSFSATPLDVGPGGAVRLSWISNAAAKGGVCLPSAGAGTIWSSLGPQASSGERLVAAPRDPGLVSFELSCGMFVAQASVEVSTPADIATQPPVLESSNPGGSAAAGSSLQATLSRNGEWLAFASDAADLSATAAAQAAKGEADQRIVLRDRRDGSNRVISVDPQGQTLSGSSSDPAISGDGAAVAFVDAQAQIHVYDNSLGRSRGVVSTTPDGQLANGISGQPALPGDGAVVVFDSTATDLGANDDNGSVSDIYQRDLLSGETRLLSLGADGEALDGPSRSPSISGDGQVIAFQTEALNLPGSAQAQKMGNGRSQVCTVHAGTAGLGVTRGCLSVNPVSGAFGDAASGSVVLSEDGRFAAFESVASNLIGGDSNGVSDIYWAGIDSQGTPLGLVRISLSASGAQANGPSSSPAISADGRYVVFESAATNLTPGDGNGSTDVYIKDVYSGRIARVATGIGGAPINAASFDATIAPDGSVLAFTTLASNLAANDLNGLPDVYSSPSPFAAPGTVNYSYTYWDSAQAGWGFNVLHQGSLLYATWYTYADDGQTLFLTVEAVALADGSFAGPVYRIAGTPFEQINGSQAFTAVTQVGDAAISFDDQGRLSLSYTVNGVSQSKVLERFLFDAAAPTCTGSTISRASARNFSDLWWNPTEAGWGLTLAHQGDVIFVLWYTYGEGGRDQWIIAATLVKQSDGSFVGALQQPSSGIALAQISGPATTFPVPEVGTAGLSFSDGETGSFNYTIGAVTQTKAIQRFVIVGPDQAKPLCVAPSAQ